jgi:hypothetical protein
MVVPEHLIPIVDQLGSWDSHYLRKLYEGLEPRTPNAVGLAFTPSNLVASWIDTAGLL